MKDTLVFVDNGFFKLVKKEFERITKKGIFHKSNHLIKSCSRYVKLIPEELE